MRWSGPLARLVSSSSPRPRGPTPHSPPWARTSCSHAYWPACTTGSPWTPAKGWVGRSTRTLWRTTSVRPTGTTSCDEAIGGGDLPGVVGMLLSVPVIAAVQPASRSGVHGAVARRDDLVKAARRCRAPRRRSRQSGTAWLAAQYIPHLVLEGKRPAKIAVEMLSGAGWAMLATWTPRWRG